MIHAFIVFPFFSASHIMSHVLRVQLVLCFAVLHCQYHQKHFYSFLDSTPCATFVCTGLYEYEARGISHYILGEPKHFSSSIFHILDLCPGLSSSLPTFLQIRNIGVTYRVGSAMQLVFQIVFSVTFIPFFKNSAHDNFSFLLVVIFFTYWQVLAQFLHVFF